MKTEQNRNSISLTFYSGTLLGLIGSSEVALADGAPADARGDLPQRGQMTSRAAVTPVV